MFIYFCAFYKRIYRTQKSKYLHIEANEQVRAPLSRIFEIQQLMDDCHRIFSIFGMKINLFLIIHWIRW